MVERITYTQNLKGFLVSLQDLPAQSYYAVFDGHGGTDAAVYAAAHLHTNIVRHKAFKTDIHTAMREGFRQTDTDFIVKAEREVRECGVCKEGVGLVCTQRFPY